MDAYVPKKCRAISKPESLSLISILICVRQGGGGGVDNDKGLVRGCGFCHQKPSLGPNSPQSLPQRRNPYILSLKKYKGVAQCGRAVVRGEQ